VLLSALGEELNHGLEGYEFAHAGHVYSVAVGVSYLGSGGYDDDFFGFEAGNYFDDAFA
jgi:hypothetical protein